MCARSVCPRAGRPLWEQDGARSGLTRPGLHSRVSVAAAEGLTCGHRATATPPFPGAAGPAMGTGKGWSAGRVSISPRGAAGLRLGRHRPACRPSCCLWLHQAVPSDAGGAGSELHGPISALRVCEPKNPAQGLPPCAPPTPTASLQEGAAPLLPAPSQGASLSKCACF